MSDINLRMTAVTPTGINITTLRARLRQELHDEDSSAYRWVDATLDRHLTRAVHELSLVLPQEQKTSLTTTPGSRDLSLASLSDLVRVEAVEYPTGQWPPCYVQFSLFDTILTLLLDGAPSAAAAVNVYWDRLHDLDGSVSTLPTLAEDVVVMGAAAYAALEWAGFATNRANVAGNAAFAAYQSWGEERLREFEAALQRLGRDARLRNAALYKPAPPGSRDAVQWPS